MLVRIGHSCTTQHRSIRLWPVISCTLFQGPVWPVIDDDFCSFAILGVVKGAKKQAVCPGKYLQGMPHMVRTGYGSLSYSPGQAISMPSRWLLIVENEAHRGAPLALEQEQVWLSGQLEPHGAYGLQLNTQRMISWSDFTFLIW